METTSLSVVENFGQIVLIASGNNASFGLKVISLLVSSSSQRVAFN